MYVATKAARDTLGCTLIRDVRDHQEKKSIQILTPRLGKRKG